MIAAAGRSKALNSYQREAILSASPARLLTMLYDRLLLDLARAEAAQYAKDWETASENLIHAQDIVAELSGSLDLTVWDGAESQLGIYNYVASALITANIHRNREMTNECIAILEPLRLSWHEAAAQPSGAVLENGVHSS